jgi:hypothetical protein
MSITRLSYKIASWTLLIGGIGHSLAELSTPKTIELMELAHKMEDYTAQILGTEINMYNFHQGFSLMMGLLLFGYGSINLLILKNNQQSNLPSNIIVLNLIITLVSALLSINFFFIIPILLTAIPFLGFLISLVTKNMKS